MNISFIPIGTIRTPFTSKEGMPIQPKGAEGVKGTVEIARKYQDGLKDLDGFSHIYLVYYFHRSEGYNLEVTPFLDNQPHGVFATRAPKRPNAIGISVVRLLSVRDNILEIENVDILDGTPLLDIKPYTTVFDVFEVEKQGWLRRNSGKVDQMRSDDRFE